MSLGNSTLADGATREDFDAHGFSIPSDRATDNHGNARTK
jgi:hypothetical protein